MSGSGATCFALFDSDEAAVKAARAIGERRREWWTAATQIEST
jgi:4-diphosphocytidyl-2-C-methyl-D-erythritol kinase